MPIDLEWPLKFLWMQWQASRHVSPPIQHILSAIRHNHMSVCFSCRIMSDDKDRVCVKKGGDRHSISYKDYNLFAILNILSMIVTI